MGYALLHHVAYLCAAGPWRRDFAAALGICCLCFACLGPRIKPPTFPSQSPPNHSQITTQSPPHRPSPTPPTAPRPPTPRPTSSAPSRRRCRRRPGASWPGWTRSAAQRTLSRDRRARCLLLLFLSFSALLLGLGFRGCRVPFFRAREMQKKALLEERETCCAPKTRHRSAKQTSHAFFSLLHALPLSPATAAARVRGGGRAQARPPRGADGAGVLLPPEAADGGGGAHTCRGRRRTCLLCRVSSHSVCCVCAMGPCGGAAVAWEKGQNKSKSRWDEKPDGLFPLHIRNPIRGYPRTQTLSKSRFWTRLAESQQETLERLSSAERKARVDALRPVRRSGLLCCSGSLSGCVFTCGEEVGMSCEGRCFCCCGRRGGV